MAIREIRLSGDEILRKKSREVTEVDDRIRSILNDMDETMHEANGVGLSAVQIGILKRIVVIDYFTRDRHKGRQLRKTSKGRLFHRPQGCRITLRGGFGFCRGRCKVAAHG